MSEGEELNCENDPRGGIYVVISGLVKVRHVLESHYVISILLALQIEFH